MVTAKPDEPAGKPWEDPDFLPWLKGQAGFSDLFVDPAPPPSAKGGGTPVKPAETEGAMASLVTALTEGMKLGATVGAAGAPKGTPKKKPPRTVRHWFFGETAVEDDEDE